MTQVYRQDVLSGGIPTRRQLDACLAAPKDTDISQYWLGQLSKARDQLDEAEQLPDGSQRRNALIDRASDAEELANKEFLKYVAEGVPLAPAISDLLLQAVILPGDKTSEGRLIAAVAIPWFDIIEMLKKHPEAAHEIPASKWEEIIAGAYHKAGFDEVTLTPRSGDYGRDIIAIKKGLGLIRVIDQVKAYKPGHLVTANDVRALVGVLQGDGASKGFLTTTSDFAPRLRDDPLIKPLMPSRLELISGPALLARLEELAKTRN